ncbi:hypothetical protein QE152_g30330 [Popillia japonica]|uniref:Uncharacterized protein n=1 Tax=Popillia japonica TaxID=7064 RepID=A0AAW1JES5_POPJA
MEEALTQIANVLQQLQSMQSKIVEKQNTNQADLRGIHLQFNESNETFDAYVQRLDNYLELRNLMENTDENDKKRVQILISCLGPKHYQILSNLTAPNLPKEQKYGELIDLLRTQNIT